MTTTTYKVQRKKSPQRSTAPSRRRGPYKGGNLPARYFDPYANDMAAADAGYDRLGASNGVIRSAIGGKSRRASKCSKRSKRSKRMKGGFIPSIMEPFIIGCSKFIYPIVGYSAYKLMNRSTRHKKR